MFEDIKSLNDLYKRYGGQRRHGIITPAGYPHIFLIHSPKDSTYKDNMDVLEDGGSEVYFAYEGKGLSQYGNLAVETHKNRKIHNSKETVYNSLFLFDLVDALLEYKGEYEYIDTITIDERNYFWLRRVKDEYEKQLVYYVEEVIDNECILKSSLGTIDGYYEKRKEDGVKPELVSVEGVEIKEGDYVDENNNIIELLGTGAKTNKANQHSYIVNSFGKRIRRKARSSTPIIEEGGIVNAFLYCINTGCGKASFLVVKKEDCSEVWGFDCGIESGACATKIAEYKANITRCINYIKDTHLNGAHFYFSKLFISHSHYDHISEIVDTMLTSTSEVWINTWIKNASKTYVNLLNMIDSKGCTIIEPLASNSTNSVKVLHPSKRIKYGYGTSKSRGFYTTSNVNNVSPLVDVHILGRSILFTGDIEHQGLNWYYKNNKMIRNVNIYVHSHHGSSTGFYVSGKSITIYDLFALMDIQMIFTRDGAYPGIVCSDIVTKNPYSSAINRTDDTGVEIYEIDIRNMSVALI